jgi:hypothetical protein
MECFLIEAWLFRFACCELFLSNRKLILTFFGYRVCHYVSAMLCRSEIIASSTCTVNWSTRTNSAALGTIQSGPKTLELESLLQNSQRADSSPYCCSSDRGGCRTRCCIRYSMIFKTSVPANTSCGGHQNARPAPLNY